MMPVLLAFTPRPVFRNVPHCLNLPKWRLFKNLSWETYLTIFSLVIYPNIKSSETFPMPDLKIFILGNLSPYLFFSNLSQYHKSSETFPMPDFRKYIPQLIHQKLNLFPRLCSAQITPLFSPLTGKWINFNM